MAYSTKFKFEVVLASLVQNGSDKDVAEEFDVHPVTLSRWKQQFLQNGEVVFDLRLDSFLAEESEDPDKIGEETAELYKCLTEYFCTHMIGLDEKIQVVRAFEQRFGLNQACRAVGLAKSTWYYRTNPEVTSRP